MRLSQREVDAMRVIVGITADRALRNDLQHRLWLHDEAVKARNFNIRMKMKMKKLGFGWRFKP